MKENQRIVGLEGRPGVGKTALLWELFDPRYQPQEGELLPIGAGKNISIVGEARDFPQIKPPSNAEPAFGSPKNSIRWVNYFLNVEQHRATLAMELIHCGLPVFFDRTIFSIAFFRMALKFFDFGFYEEFDYTVKVFGNALKFDKLVMPDTFVIVDCQDQELKRRLLKRGVSEKIFTNSTFLEKLRIYYQILRDESKAKFEVIEIDNSADDPANITQAASQIMGRLQGGVQNRHSDVELWSAVINKIMEN